LGYTEAHAKARNVNMVTGPLSLHDAARSQNGKAREDRSEKQYCAAND